MKWFLILLVACAVLAAVLLVRPSPLVVTNEPAAAKNILPPPAATPAPLAEVPLEKTPEPPEAVAKLPPITPAPQPNLAALAQNRALWPKQVLLAKPVVFPVVINQRPMGTVTLSPGRSVDVLAVSLQGLTLAFQGGTRLVPADSTNVLEMARRLDTPPASSGTTASRTDVAAVPPPLSSPASVSAPARPPLAAVGNAAPPPRTAVTPPLENIRRQPRAFPAAIVPQIHEYLRAKIAATSGATPVPPLDPSPAFAYYAAMDRFDALERDPGGIYRLAALSLGRADWLLTQRDSPARLRGVYLASITATSIARYAPDPLLTSAIYDAYLYPRIDLVPVKAGFTSQTRDGVISNCTRLFAPDDLLRRLQFFDLQYKHARTAGDRDAALYGKAYALNRAHRTREALEVWSHIRREGEMGWMKGQIAEAWKTKLTKEQNAAKKN